MRSFDKYVIFLFACLIALGAGGLYGTLATAKKEKDPLAVNDRVTIELIATMEDGKVRVYRMMDYVAGLTARTCHITVGELHGKTVTMDCD